MTSGDNKEGQRSTLQLGEQELYLLFTPASFPDGSYHSNSFIKGHTRQSTSETHLLWEVCSTAAPLLHAAGRRLGQFTTAEKVDDTL